MSADQGALAAPMYSHNVLPTDCVTLGVVAGGAGRRAAQEAPGGLRPAGGAGDEYARRVDTLFRLADRLVA